MATNTAAIIVPGEGHFYVAPTGTTKPTGVAVPSAPFVEIGHTSYDEPLTIERDGGDITTLKTWQSTAARTIVEPITYSLNFGALEHDDLALNLYYGGGAVNATTDEFEVTKTPAVQDKSLFVRIIDGAEVNAYYFGTVGIIGVDSQELDPQALWALPLTATVLDTAALSYLFSIKNSQTVLP
jgi:hypothetical protein